MSFLRVGYWVAGLLRQSVLWLCIMVLSFSLILIGGLFWINNRWAFIPDNNPASSFNFSAIFDTLNGSGDLSALDPDGDGQIPLTGGKLVKGNGDQDDNKQEPVVIVYQPGTLIEPNFSDAPVLCQGGWTVKSYLGFGHLKVFPDAPVSIIINENAEVYSKKAAVRVTCGGLLVV